MMQVELHKLRVIADNNGLRVSNKETGVTKSFDEDETHELIIALDMFNAAAKHRL